MLVHPPLPGYDPSTRLTFFHPPARRLNPTVTVQMEAILAKQLCLSVSQRYAHPSKMQEDLLSLLESYPNRVANTGSVTPLASPLQPDASQQLELSQSSALLSVGIFAGICVLLIIGVLFFTLLHP